MQSGGKEGRAGGECAMYYVSFETAVKVHSMARMWFQPTQASLPLKQQPTQRHYHPALQMSVTSYMKWVACSLAAFLTFVHSLSGPEHNFLLGVTTCMPLVSHAV